MPLAYIIWIDGNHISNALPRPERPVDPGYGVDQGGRPDQGLPGYPPTVGGGPARPGRPVDPGYGLPGRLPDGGSIWPGTPDQGLPELPPEIAPPIFLPKPPGEPPTVWPPVGGVQPPIVMPPPGVWPPPKPGSGYVIVYLPNYGVTYIKLGVSVGGGPIMPPTAQPKA